MLKKNITKKYSSIKRGIILGFQTPSLPDNVLKFTNLPIIRIFRVLGGISILLLLSNKLPTKGFSLVIIFIALLISILFLIYQLVLIYYRIIQIIKIWKSDKFDVRNSPLDILLKQSARLVLCIKGTCEAGTPLATGMALGFGVDTILQASGRDGVFTPFIVQKLNSIIGDPNSQAQMLRNLQRKAELINQDELAAKELLNSVQNWGNDSIFSRKDAEELLDVLNKHRAEIQEQKSSISKAIKDQIGNTDWTNKK
jgi:disulfide bond formation protein DsbB